jgi:hypothetical protein
LGVVSLGFLAGCTHLWYTYTIPGQHVGLEPLKTNATYDVLGETQGTSSGTYLFGFIPTGGEDKEAVIEYAGVSNLPILGGGGTRMGAVARAALYNAIEAKPGADALLAPRWQTVTKNYIVYREVTVTVKGKAIRFNKSAD